MIPLTYEENKKKFAIYPKENSMLIKMMKIHLNYITKKIPLSLYWKIILELLIIFLIKDTKHQNNSSSIS